MYVIDKPSKWEDYLHIVEFTYNNGYQTSTKMSPFEIMHGRRCNTPSNGDNPVDRLMIGPNVLREMEYEVHKVKHNLKIAQDRKNFM